MTRAAWPTPEQKAWLEARVPAFIDAQQKKITSTLFFPLTHKEWQQQFPTLPPDEKELEEAKGNLDIAVAKKKKFWENRVFYWFHNHTRGSSGTGTRGVLKLHAKPKLLPPLQAYQTLFYETKLKPLVDEAWTKYKESIPAGEKLEKSRFTIMNELVQKAYAEESAEVREQVEAHRRKLKEGAMQPESNNERNEKFHRAIDKLPRTLSTVAGSIVEQTGWNVSILVGGPDPRLHGKIVTYMLHLGQTPEAETFEEFLGSASYEEYITSTFDDYLNASFPLSEREARALNPASRGNTPVGTAKGLVSSKDGEVDKQGVGLSEYEVEKQRNILKNAELLRNFDEEYAKKHGTAALPEPPKTVKKSRKKTEKPTAAAAEQRTSSRLASPANVSNRDATPSNDHQAPTSTSTIDPTNVNTGLATTTNKTTTDDANSKESQSNAMMVEQVASQVNGSQDTDMGNHTNDSAPVPSSLTLVPAQVAPKVNGSDDVDMGNDNHDNMPAPSSPRLIPAVNSAPSTERESSSGTPAPEDKDTSPTGDSPNKATAATPNPADATSTPSPNSGAMVSALPRSTNESLASPSASGPINGDDASWMTPFLSYLNGLSQDKKWLELVSRWVDFERKQPPVGRFPIRSRPKEVAWWMKRHKQQNPNVNASEFGTTWNIWWKLMQPEWRRKDQDSLLNRDVPLGETWDILARGGSNGFFLVIMCLSWWFQGFQSTDNTDVFWSSVNDVTWVLGEMTKVLPGVSVGQKRPSVGEEDTEQKKPQSKRARK